MEYHASIYKRVTDRMGLVEFCQLSEAKQETIVRSCIVKQRFATIQQVVRALIRKFDRQQIILVYYKCRYCDGFHFTSKRKRIHKRPIFEMIAKHKEKMGLPMPKLDPDKHFRKSPKDFLNKKFNLQ